MMAWLIFVLTMIMQIQIKLNFPTFQMRRRGQYALHAGLPQQASPVTISWFQSSNSNQSSWTSSASSASSAFWASWASCKRFITGLVHRLFRHDLVMSHSSTSCASKCIDVADVATIVNTNAQISNLRAP